MRPINDYISKPQAFKPAIQQTPKAFGSEFQAEPLPKPEKNWYEAWAWDPLMWTLEKINRPQQALFAYMSETMAGGEGGKAALDAFLHGDTTRFADIMDDIGWKGKAGELDWMDIPGALGELFLDPVNLIGVGPLTKIQKLRQAGKALKTAQAFRDAAKGADAIATATVAVEKAQKVFDVADMTVKGVKFADDAEKAGLVKRMTEAGIKLKDGKLPYNLASPTELMEAIASEGEKLLGPKALSHFIQLGGGYGAGKYQWAVPGSNKFLEPALGVGKAIRGATKGFLSTQPTNESQALWQGTQNIIKRQKAGVYQLMHHYEKSLPKEWIKEWGNGRLTDLVETGAGDLVKTMPAEVQEAYEMGRWFSEHLPQLEEMSAVMTQKLDVTPGAFGKKTYADLMETMSMDPDSPAVVNHFMHSITKEAREYIQKNDIRNAKKYRGSSSLSTNYAGQLQREIPGTIADINKGPRWIFTPKGKLKEAWIGGNKSLQSDIERAARKFADGEVTEDAASLGTRLGQSAEDLFADSSHYKQFDKFFEDDFFKGVSIRLANHVQARAVGETFQHIMGAKNEMEQLAWARPIADAPDGWVPLSDKIPSRSFKNMDPKLKNIIDESLFDPEMAKAIEGGMRALYDPEETIAIFGTLRKGLSYLRASTILPFLGYHINNAVGNRWGRWMADVADPKYDLMVADIVPHIRSGNTKALREMNITLSGKKFTGEELMHGIMSNDIASGGSITSDIVAYGAEAGELNKPSKWYNLFDPTSRKQAGAHVAKIIEDHDRMAHFIGRLDKGDTIADAAASVRTHLFDYGNLTNIEKGTPSRIGARDFPMFYTWYRKNMGLTFQKMWEYPGRMSLPVKARNALSGIYGDPDSEYAVPEYLRDQFYFYLGKDEQGEGKFLDPEKYLPPLSAGKFMQRSGKGAYEEFIGSLTPGLKTFAEWGSGTEAFSGRDVEGIPGEKKAFMGGEIPPAAAYFGKSFRILNSINKALWPSYTTGEGDYVRTGEGKPGDRPAGLLFEQGVVREWAGRKQQTTAVQRNRYFEAISPGGRINGDLKKIDSKMSGDISNFQRDSYIKERTKLLWEKAEVLRQYIEDGTDPFTGKEMPWNPTMPAPDSDTPHAMRDVYTELHGTLRALYFGEPAKRWELVVEQKTKIKPEEAKQVFDTMTRLKIDMLGKDMENAIQTGGKAGAKIFDNRVTGPIRDIVKTKEYYERGDGSIGENTHVYDYNYDYRKNLMTLWDDYLRQGYQAGLYTRDGYKTRLRTYQEKYLPDYD